MTSLQESNTKQAAWVALGSLCSFAFGIVSAMILSRYFDKAEYGTYKQVLYVYNSLLTVFTLGLPRAFSYFLPRSPKEEAKDLIRKLTNLFFLLGGILSIFLFLTSGLIADVLNNPDLKSALKIFALVPFLMMPTMGLEGILATYRKTKFLAVYTFLTRLIMLITVAVPTIVFELTCNECLIGFVVGSFISFCVAIYLKYYPLKGVSRKATSCTFKDIFKFTFPLFTASIWGVLINSTDQFFISRYFGESVFAEFSNGAMELPFVGMITGACATVLTPLFTKQMYEKADFKKVIYPVWHNAFRKSAMLIYPITIFCIFDASLIMSVMYGDTYTVSGDYFRIKLITYFVRIIMFQSILIALGATKFYSKVFMWAFILLLPIEYASVRIFNNPLVVTAVHALFSIIMSLIFLRYIAKTYSVPFLSMFPWVDIGKIMLASIITLFIVFILRKYAYNMISIKLYTLFIDMVLFGIIFYIMSEFLKMKYLDILKPILKK